MIDYYNKYKKYKKIYKGGNPSIIESKLNATIQGLKKNTSLNGEKVEIMEKLKTEELAYKVLVISSREIKKIKNTNLVLDVVVEESPLIIEGTLDEKITFCIKNVFNHISSILTEEDKPNIIISIGSDKNIKNIIEYNYKSEVKLTLYSKIIEKYKLNVDNFNILILFCNDEQYCNMKWKEVSSDYPEYHVYYNNEILNLIYIIPYQLPLENYKQLVTLRHIIVDSKKKYDKSNIELLRTEDSIILSKKDYNPIMFKKMDKMDIYNSFMKFTFMRELLKTCNKFILNGSNIVLINNFYYNTNGPTYDLEWINVENRKIIKKELGFGSFIENLYLEEIFYFYVFIEYFKIYHNSQFTLIDGNDTLLRHDLYNSIINLTNNITYNNSEYLRSIEILHTEISKTDNV